MLQHTTTLLCSILFAASLLSLCHASCILKPTRFRTNNLRNPLAIANTATATTTTSSSSRPVFSWALGFPDGSYSPPTEVADKDKNKDRDHYQTAYRIVCTEITVTSTSASTSNGNQKEAEAATVLWDSGKVPSRETLQIEYAGVPLKSFQRIQWKVQVWDQNGEECLPADEDPWLETGIQEDDDDDDDDDETAWDGAEWIARHGPLPSNASLCSMMAETNEENQVPRFRAVLEIPNNKDNDNDNGIDMDIVQARAYIVGLGYYQLYINGEKVGDAMLDPGWTTYSKRVLYAAHDVTSMLSNSKAAVDDDKESNTTIHSSATTTSSHRRYVIGVELGNGWWNPLPLLHNGHQNIRQHLVAGQNITSSRPMFRLLIVGTKTDGTTVTLLKTHSGEDSKWRVAGSPTVFNNVYLGEKYDARLEPLYDGWATLDYTPSDIWKPAVKADIAGLGRIQAQELPPIRRQNTILTSTLLSSKRDEHGNLVGIFDTGINHAGSCRIMFHNNNAKLPTGSIIRLRYGELLTKDHNLNVMTAVVGQIKSNNPKAPCQPEVAYQQDTIITGEGPIDWTPSWSWHGFRYVEVTLPPLAMFDDLDLECFTMRSDVDVIANFTSSNPWLSDLRQFVRNTFEANMMSVQSDCPHRERFGYGGDALGSGEAALSIYDLSAFYRKRILDFNEAQRLDASGKLQGFTETSPYVGIATAGIGPGTGPIGWQTFQPEAQLWLYKYYGDTRTMRDSFPHTLAYIDLLDREPPQIEQGLGDWMPVISTDVAFTGRGFQHMSYLAFANITELLGMPSDIARHYRHKAAQLVKNINHRFLKTDSGAYAVGVGDWKGQITQTGQGMALFNSFLSFNVSMQQKALWQLAYDARASSHMEGACQCRNEWAADPICKYAQGGPGPHMTAGLFGIKWVLMALADGGLNDLAYELITTKTFPGLGWMMNNPFANATTIWESFFFSDNVFSHNHPMFGSTEVWLLQSVAGIQPAPGAKGMDHVLIRPNPPRQLSHAAASYESPRGIFSIGWERVNHGKTINLNITVPPNCHATVYFPARIGSRMLDQNHLAVEDARWVPSIAIPEHGSYVFEVGSGYHEFQEEPSTTIIE